MRKITWKIAGSKRDNTLTASHQALGSEETKDTMVHTVNQTKMPSEKNIKYLSTKNNGDYS